MQLSQLKLKKGNPRFIKDERFQSLVKSIKEMPKMLELRPMVYDPKTFEVLAGNMRLRALKELNYLEIPDSWAIPADKLTEEEKRRFLIVDNIGFGAWDMDILANEFNLEELNDWGLDLDFPVIEEEEQEEETPTSLQLIVTAKNEAELFQLFEELKEKGFEVKVK